MPTATHTRTFRSSRSAVSLLRSGLPFAPTIIFHPAPLEVPNDDDNSRAEPPPGADDGALRARPRIRDARARRCSVPPAVSGSGAVI